MAEAVDSPDGWQRVLVVDDGTILLGALCAALHQRGYDVHAIDGAANPRVIAAAIGDYLPDVVLLNQALLVRGQRCLGRWLGRGIKFLVLRQSDQPTAPSDLLHTLANPITICTPADLPVLLTRTTRTRNAERGTQN
jgi:DNA-binding response OmpR family regulator